MKRIKEVFKKLDQYEKCHIITFSILINVVIAFFIFYSWFQPFPWDAERFNSELLFKIIVYASCIAILFYVLLRIMSNVAYKWKIYRERKYVDNLLSMEEAIEVIPNASKYNDFIIYLLKIGKFYAKLSEEDNTIVITSIVFNDEKQERIFECIPKEVFKTLYKLKK